MLDEGLNIISKRLDVLNIFKRLYFDEKSQESNLKEKEEIEMSDTCKEKPRTGQGNHKRKARPDGSDQLLCNSFRSGVFPPFSGPSLCVQPCRPGRWGKEESACLRRR